MRGDLEGSLQEEEGNSKSAGGEEDNSKASEVSPMRGDLEGSPLTDEQVATIHYELWKLTGDDTHRAKAVDMYRALYENKPKYEFKKRIEEMEG